MFLALQSTKYNGLAMAVKGEKTHTKKKALEEETFEFDSDMNNTIKVVQK